MSPLARAILAILTLILIFPDFLPAASPAAKIELTPNSIRRHIKEDGARLTISRLRNEKTGSRTNYEWVALKVESGELVWLQVADALMPGLEPSYRQAMFISGARAMGEHPENAVRLLKDRRWPLEYLCDAPFQEISREGWENHLLKIQAGLDGFNHPSFQREKELCLKYIDWALEHYPQPMPKELKVGWHIPQELP